MGSVQSPGAMALTEATGDTEGLPAHHRISLYPPCPP